MGVLDRFGEGIRTLRARRGMKSQADLALRSGVAVTTVNKIETGKRLPDFATTGALLEAMGADLHELGSVLDELNGRVPVARRGSPRDAWVRLLIDDGLHERNLAAIASGAGVHDTPRNAADLIASAAAAGETLAVRAIDRVRRNAAGAEIRVYPELDAAIGETLNEGPGAVAPGRPRRRR